MPKTLPEKLRYSGALGNNVYAPWPQELLYEAADEITRLNDQWQHFQKLASDHRNELETEITRLRAALDEALEVAALFAYRVPNVGLKQPDGTLVALAGIEVEHFRAARRFYEKHKGGGDG